MKHLTYNNGNNISNNGNDPVVNRFTDIIFNFPHLAIENAMLHSSLLAHTIYQSKCILTNITNNNTDSINGMIYISLAVAQGVRWRIHKMAEMNQAKVVCQLPFSGETQEDFPGYEIKRHHTGASFIRRVGSCTCYCICAIDESESDVTTITDTTDTTGASTGIVTTATVSSDQGINGIHIDTTTTTPTTSNSNSNNSIGCVEYPNIFEFVMKIHEHFGDTNDASSNNSNNYSNINNNNNNGNMNNGIDDKLDSTLAPQQLSKKELKKLSKKRKSHTHYGDNFTMKMIPDPTIAPTMDPELSLVSIEPPGSTGGNGDQNSTSSTITNSVASAPTKTKTKTVYEGNVCQKQFAMEQVYMYVYIYVRVYICHIQCRIVYHLSINLCLCIYQYYCYYIGCTHTYTCCTHLEEVW